MNILFVTNMYPSFSDDYSGIFVKEQRDSLIESREIEKSEVYFIDGRLSKWNYLKSLWEIPTALKKYKPDLIHIHYGISGMFLLITQPNIPVVLTLHGSDINKRKSKINHTIQKWLTLRVMQRATKTIILNDEMQSKLNSFGNRLVKIPCGTDTSFFKPLNKKNSKSNQLTIGFPSDKNRWVKNYGLFEQIIDVLSEEYNIEVIEFNNMSRGEVRESLNKLDLLCMTSLSEGSPQIIKEAMACNVPIVSTKVGDVEDLLFQVKNCYVIDSFDKKDFIQPIKTILELPSSERISDGRERLSTMSLDSASISQKLINLYKSL